MTMLPRWTALIDCLKDKGQVGKELSMGKGKSPPDGQNGSDTGKERGG